MNFSFWELDTLYKNCDIVIIGAGFTGLWSAFHLKEANPELRIAIADKNNYPLGASTRNAGFACFGSISEILSDARSMGWKATLDLIEKRFTGLQLMQSKLDPKDFDLEICGGYELMKNPVSLAELNLVNEKIKYITGIDHTFSEDSEAKQRFGFGDFGTEQIISSPLEGSLHPGKLLELLIQQCVAKGVRFLWNHPLKSFDVKAHEVQIHFDKISITSAKLLICTNGFTPALLPGLDIHPARGQVLMTSEIPDLKIKGVFHSDEGFIYFRNVGNRILLGGMRNLDMDNENSDAIEENRLITSQLTKYLQDVILPGKTYDITHRWSGIMAMGQDKSYLLGSRAPNVYHAVRLSGMGVALAPAIGLETVKLLEI